MLSIKDIINARNPVLGLHPRLDSYIEISKNYVSRCVTGDKYNLAVALATLHQLALDGNSTNPDVISGRVIEEKEGDLSRKLSDVGNGGDFFASTNYGREFNMLKRGLTFGYRNRFISGCR